MAHANAKSPAEKECVQCHRPAEPGGGRCRFCILEVEACEAFWAVIVRQFPNAQGGDLSPERTIGQRMANVDAIDEWIRNNVPSEHHDEPVAAEGETHPRSPNTEELRQLIDCLRAQGHDPDTAAELVRCASLAVFDDYVSGSPGYAGKVMCVVWDGGPSFFDVFIWEKGKLLRSDRDDDAKQCGECGSTNGTVCRDCRKARSARSSEANPDTLSPPTR